MATAKPARAAARTRAGAPAGPHSNPDPERAPERNPGIPLDLAWVRDVRVGPAVIEQRAAALAAREPPARDAEAARLLRVVRLLDLTTLSGDDTPRRVARLAAEARRPLPAALLRALGQRPGSLGVAAVCVYHRFVGTALRALEGSGIPVAAASAGFPHGLGPMSARLAEIEASVEDGALEIDAVTARVHALTGDWRGLYDEVRAFRRACGPARLKAILATGELGTPGRVARAALVCAMAGADFVKTSTGKERVNATLPAGVTLARILRAYRDRSGHVVGLKAAGGIRTAEQALQWLALLDEELGEPWAGPHGFRIGASGLLSDVRGRLERLAGAGRGAERPARNRQPARRAPRGRA
ncbi:MAG TPA: deoxyribose-phosphate aldolase [Longimicrobiales bacterium]|nr:deoxyribose-phosphate aldolase [Longimicrobiales bacterium]